MMAAMFVMVLVLALVLFYYWLGFNAGVAATEKRWADAVARKADAERTTP